MSERNKIAELEKKSKKFEKFCNGVVMCRKKICNRLEKCAKSLHHLWQYKDDTISKSSPVKSNILIIEVTISLCDISISLNEEDEEDVFEGELEEDSVFKCGLQESSVLEGGRKQCDVLGNCVGDNCLKKGDGNEIDLEVSDMVTLINK